MRLRNIVLASLMSLAITSCMTEARIKRSCDKFFKVCGTSQVETVVKDTVIKVDTIIGVPLPPDTVKIAGDVQIINGVCTFKPVCVESSLITACVEVKDGKLSVKSYVNKKSIQSSVNMNITLKGAIRETTDTKMVPVKYIPIVYKWAFIIVLAQLAMCGFWLANKFTGFNPVSIIKKLFVK